jgi:Zn-dependent protease
VSVVGGSSIQLGRVFGIRIGASPSWFVVLFLLIYFLSNRFADVLAVSSTTAFLLAVSAAALFFGSLILHELGHALVARRNGIEIAGIDLWFFGGLAKLSRDSRSPGEEFRVAAAGPAVTLAIVALCLAAGALLSRGGAVVDSAVLSHSATTPAVALIGWLAMINTVLFVFNMVPAFPLDGGRIARAIAWKVTGDKNRGTRFSGRLGQGFSWLMIGFGFYLLVSGISPGNGIYFMILGWFLGSAAKGAVASSDFSERIDGVTAGDLMDPEPVAVPADATLTRAQDEFFLRYGEPWFPVIDGDGHLLGAVRAERLDAEITSGRPALTVSDVMEPVGHEDGQIAGDTPLESLLSSEPLRRLGALMVVDRDGVLRGVVTVDQVRRALTAAAPSRVA